ncbi:MAG: STAS domain-containing protein [Rhodocyclaceae bacterium]|nr:STAS domain-containing protein [Rhodocyclaceae bacterium]
MIREVEGRLAVEGVMTHDSARALLEAGTGALKPGATLFDLSSVTDVDSSGLAVIFGWQRAALAAGSSVHIANPPANLVSLAEMYGVSELLPVA